MIAVDHVNYDAIIERLNTEDYDGIIPLLDVASSITLASHGKVTVLEGCVCFNGDEVINPLTDRILQFVREGLPFKPMTKFLENLMDNPSRTAIQELYLFLEDNKLPLTEDGCMLAYRKVDNDYMSFHANPDGTRNSNKVGDVVEMKRNEVDDVRDNVCSNGLHFCSLSYLPKYMGGSGRVMLVKINPADVVSIPSDYNNAKGRTCLYEVIAEHTDPEKEYKDFTVSAVVGADGSELDVGSYLSEPDEETCVGCGEYLDDCICADWCSVCGEVNSECTCDANDTTLGTKPDGSLFHNLRNSLGRFTKRS